MSCHKRNFCLKDVQGPQLPTGAWPGAPYKGHETMITFFVPRNNNMQCESVQSPTNNRKSSKYIFKPENITCCTSVTLTVDIFVYFGAGITHG